MANVLIVAYLLIVLAMIAVILLQRSEGGGLGMGSSSTGLISVRGSANLLTRTTAILAALFFATAIALTILSELDRGTQTILDRATTNENGEAPATVLDALKQLQQQQSGLPVPPGAATTPDQPPAGGAPATPAPATDAGANGAAPAAPADAQPAPAAPAAPAVDSALPVPQGPAPAGDQQQAPAP
jgi:preprotein translocase subunit SecG